MYRKFIQTCFNADGHLIVRCQLMKRHHREIFNWVMQQYPEYVTYNDKMKAIRQGEYRRCEQCSAIISYNKHSDYCSRKCLAQSDYFKNAVLAKLHGDEANTKRAESFKRYGKDNPLFNDRNKGTANLKVTHGKNNPLAKSSESRTKRDYTMVERHTSQNETIKSRAIDKARRTRESVKRELLDSIQLYAYGKLCNAIDNNDVNSIVEHIGDVAFVAIIICMQTNNYIAVNEIYPNRHDNHDLLWHIINLAENLRDIIYDDDYVENTLAYLTAITQHYNLSFE